LYLSLQIFDYWRVGLRWDIFPEKLWLNRTVPYLISPLYGMHAINILKILIPILFSLLLPICYIGNIMLGNYCKLTATAQRAWFMRLHDRSNYRSSFYFDITIIFFCITFSETEHRILIYQAIRTINFLTCIKFVPWTGKEKDYLLIWPVKYPSGWLMIIYNNNMLYMKYYVICSTNKCSIV